MHLLYWHEMRWDLKLNTNTGSHEVEICTLGSWRSMTHSVVQYLLENITHFIPSLSEALSWLCLVVQINRRHTGSIEMIDRAQSFKATHTLLHTVSICLQMKTYIVYFSKTWLDHLDNRYVKYTKMVKTQSHHKTSVIRQGFWFYHRHCLLQWCIINSIPIILHKCEVGKTNFQIPDLLML